MSKKHHQAEQTKKPKKETTLRYLFISNPEIKSLTVQKITMEIQHRIAQSNKENLVEAGSKNKIYNP